ncbi:MAG: hypothetical protein ACREA3_09465 [Nitrosotalea sp.]
MKTMFVLFISFVFLLIIVMMNNSVKGGCMVSNDWPNAPCYDKPSSMSSKETLRNLWAPYYQYKGASWMEMMKTQMIDAIKNGTVQSWRYYSDSNNNVWTYYSLNDQIPFFIQPGTQNYTKSDHILLPLQQFKTGTPVEDTQCKKDLVLWLKKDGIPVCISMQSFPILLQRGFLLPDSYEQFAINESKRFIRSSHTFEFNGMENTLKLTVTSVEQSIPPIVSIQATFDSSIPGYGDRSGMNIQPYLTHHTMLVTISNTNEVTQAVIDRQWDEIHQKFLKY